MENGESRHETRKISKDEYDPERLRFSKNNGLSLLPFYTPTKKISRTIVDSAGMKEPEVTGRHRQSWTNE